MQSNSFDLDKRYAHFSMSGDPSQRLSLAIDWELFGSLPDRIDDKPRKNKAGRKPTDRVLKFKMLVLYAKYRLSDEQSED